MEVIQIAVSLLLAVASYLAWHKYRDRDYFWIAVISSVALVLKAINYVLGNFLQLPSELNLIRNGASIVIVVVLILFLVKIGIWGSKKTS
jgi:uncharacterized membrane protein